MIKTESAIDVICTHKVKFVNPMHHSSTSVHCLGWVTVERAWLPLWLLALKLWSDKDERKTLRGVQHNFCMMWLVISLWMTILHLTSVHPPSTFLLTSFLSILCLTALANVKMVSSTFWPDFALVSKNSAPYSAARVCPLCSVTTRDSSRSHLLPRTITSTFCWPYWVVRGKSWGEQKKGLENNKLNVVNMYTHPLLLWQPFFTGIPLVYLRRPGHYS